MKALIQIAWLLLIIGIFGCQNSYVGSFPDSDPDALSYSLNGSLALRVDQTTFLSSGPVGGPFTPASTNVTITNNTRRTVHWAVTHDQPFISISKLDSTLGTHQTESIQISIAPSANTLAAGTYTDNLIFSQTPGTKTWALVVRLTIEPTQTIPTICDRSSDTWQNKSFATQTSTFNVEFDAIPSEAQMDGLIGLSAGAGTTFTDYAAIIRFSNSGFIDVRKGALYSADQAVHFTPNLTYHIRAAVDLLLHTYSVFVTPAGESEIAIANNFAFRSEQAQASNLSNRGIYSALGTLQICNFDVKSAQPQSEGILSITPSENFLASGTSGGPFSPLSKTYTLTNTGSQTLNFAVSKTQAFVTLSKISGIIAAGASDSVTVSINTNANGLANGTYSDSITFTNQTNGNGNTNRMVGLTVGTAGCVMRNSIQQYGVTWTFDRLTCTGQFVTGDYWVIGPVKIQSVSPGPSAGQNGSMINPRGTGDQAYDSRAGAYNGSLAITFPITINPPASLISSVSLATWGGTSNGTLIDRASVLTVLSSAAASTDFRPPYAGINKPIHSAIGLRTDLLPSLAPVSGTPSLASVFESVRRPWIDHNGGWQGREVHPDQNMPNYGREISTTIGEAANMLMLNPAIVGDKTPLAIALTQIGIDNYYALQDGVRWVGDGGHGSGRKFPILFAGLMLNNPQMLGIGTAYLSRSNAFGEDAQTFYVSQADINIVHNWWGNTDVDDHGVPYINYIQSDLGRPEWGIAHSDDPEKDNKNWDASYRQCCTALAWHGWILAARALGLKSLWNNNALFDYQDRYMATEPSSGWRSWSAFSEVMWDVYRSRF